MIELKLSKKLFNETYYPYLCQYNTLKEIYYGGAGSGKSHFIGQKIILKCLTEKRKVLVIRKVQTSQKESCWRLILDILSQWQILGYMKVNKSDMTIEFPNGSVILFKGLDDPEKIKSIVGLTDCWCEEATELTEEDFDQLELRIRPFNMIPQIFISFNPISKANWTFKRWFENGTNDFVLKTTYKDNKFLSKEYIEKLINMINTNPTYYKIYALGEFCTLDKLVYNNWKIEEFNYQNIKGQLAIGLDFGFSNDPTALIASIIDEDNNKIYIFREWGSTNKTNNEIAEIIKTLGFSKSLIIADSAEPKSIEEIRRLGIQRIRESTKGPDSIIHGIQKLQQYEIIVYPDCREIITELENYSWQKDKKTNEYINKPIDLFNHYLDALRYSLQCINNKHLKVMDKKLLGL